MVVDNDKFNQIIIDELLLYTKWLIRQKQLRFSDYSEIDLLIEAYLNGNNY